MEQKVNVEKQDIQEMLDRKVNQDCQDNRDSMEPREKRVNKEIKE